MIWDCLLNCWVYVAGCLSLLACYLFLTVLVCICICLSSVLNCVCFVVCLRYCFCNFVVYAAFGLVYVVCVAFWRFSLFNLLFSWVFVFGWICCLLIVGVLACRFGATTFVLILL